LKRRQFIALLGGAAAAWPLAARAQQMRRIGVLEALAADDPALPVRSAAFAQGMQELGWGIGRNLQIVYRFGASDADLRRKLAAELIALKPEVILANHRLRRRCSRQVAACLLCL
jgi:putative tryptophan/tyrosine transport system substrate-binding protein